MDLGVKSNDNAVRTTAYEKVVSDSERSSSADCITFEHPLLNPLVIDLIVKHLHPSFEQLKTLRLISKVWTQVTQLQWRKSFGVLTLVPDPLLFTKRKYKKGLQLSKFFTEFHDPNSPAQLSQKPFSKYKLKGMTFDFEACSEPGDPSNYFWNTIGPLMESVHFYKCSFVKPMNVSRATCPLVQFLVGSIPNLKDLALTDVTTEHEGKPDREDDESDEDEFLEREVVDRGPHSNLRTLTVYGNLDKNLCLVELLKSCPGLEKIKGINQVSQNEERLLQQICSVRYHSMSTPRPLSNLKHVDLINSNALPDWISNSTPLERAPHGTQLPLETLTLHLKADRDVAENLEKYLKYFFGTLKTLKAFRAPVGPPPYITFLSDTSMSLLTELHLCGTIASNFGFLKSIPSLKRLKIDLGCFEKRDVVKKLIKKSAGNYQRMKYQKYPGDMVLNVREDLRNGILCSKLEFLEIDYDFPEESLRLLGNWMPNLKTLKTILNGRTVPIVCGVWRELTDLVCLHGSKIENSCFILDEEKPGFSGAPSPRLKICDLKDLERFQLGAYCNEAKLTDDVVFKGFLKMPGLKCVEICVNSQMSKEAEEELRKTVPFCKVLRASDEGRVGSSRKGISGCRCDRCAFRRDVEIYEQNGSRIVDIKESSAAIPFQRKIISFGIKHKGRLIKVGSKKETVTPNANRSTP